MPNISKQCKGGTLHLVKIPGKYRVQVAKIAERVLIEASKLFAYRKPVETVIFSSTPYFVTPEVGIGAHATIQGDIVVNIDFSRRDIKRVIQKELSSAIYHEFSHMVRASVHKKLYATLSESLITEGIASYIEKKVFRKKVLWIESIKNEREYWLQARKSMYKKDYDHNEWFFGTKKLPRWIGYRLGYLLVSSFMKRQKNLSLSQLVRVRSSEILQGLQNAR
ncbi:MAG: hypothetical protein HYS60_02340 [Candidatus Wildermuthbacteria bacterium]|nr:hypothetical protein [Candidatus Wildermuthbacteria bacterium]